MSSQLELPFLPPPSTTSTTTEAQTEFSELNAFSSELNTFSTNSNATNILDVMITVNDPPKEFQAHSAVLGAQSEYFRSVFESDSVKRDQITGVFLIEKPHISTGVFEVLLIYIYGGTLQLEHCDISYIIDLSEAAEELSLISLTAYLQDHLIQTKATLMPKYLNRVLHWSFQSATFSKLKAHMITHLNVHPWKLTISSVSCSLEFSVLYRLLTDPDQYINEGVAWDILVKWGIAQHPVLASVPFEKWTEENFGMMRKTIGKLLPLIRFSDISRNDYKDRVLPYYRIIPYELRLGAAALQYYINEEISCNLKITLQDSILINHVHATLIVKWILEAMMPQGTNKCIYTKSHRKSSSGSSLSTLTTPPTTNELKNEYFASLPHQKTPKPTINELKNKYFASLSHRKTLKPLFRRKPVADMFQSYNFKLLYRKSADIFSNYHSRCDQAGSTVVIAKIHGASRTLVGGYSPIGLNPKQATTKGLSLAEKCFIFSMGQDPQNDRLGITRMTNATKDIEQTAVLSRVLSKYASQAVRSAKDGPCFGKEDLRINLSPLSKKSCKAAGDRYAQTVVDLESFEIADCEVFQIVKE